MQTGCLQLVTLAIIVLDLCGHQTNGQIAQPDPHIRSERSSSNPQWLFVGVALEKRHGQLSKPALSQSALLVINFHDLCPRSIPHSGSVCGLDARSRAKSSRQSVSLRVS